MISGLNSHDLIILIVALMSNDSFLYYFLSKQRIKK